MTPDEPIAARCRRLEQKGGHNKGCTSINVAVQLPEKSVEETVEQSEALVDHKPRKIIAPKSTTPRLIPPRSQELFTQILREPIYRI